MIQEIERPFRPGESANRPYWGKIADASFPNTLKELAVSRGFVSQNALAQALNVTQGTVGMWCRGAIPLPETFGNLLILLNLNEEERESLVESYAKRLGEQDANLRLNRLKVSRSLMRPSENPVDKWIKKFCIEREITLSQLNNIFGGVYFSRSVNRKSGMESLEHIRQNAKDVLGLSEEQIASLSEAIDQEIQQRIKEGHRFQHGLSGGGVTKEQKRLIYRTYNGAQAGKELGVTRERVRQLRIKFSLPPLLTDENIEVLRNHLKETKTRREKHQKSRIQDR